MSNSGSGYTGLVVGYWPDLSGVDPEEQYRLTKAVGRVTADRDLLTGEVLSPRDREVKPRLWITCDQNLHHDPQGGAPMIAQVWDTEDGALFVASIGGAAGQRPREASDPFDPPAFLFGDSERASKVQGAGSGPGADLVPIVVVRSFLPPRDEVHLWVKCAVHGRGLVDPIKLAHEYEADRQARVQHDSMAMRVVRLHSVGALYCSN